MSRRPASAALLRAFDRAGSAVTFFAHNYLNFFRIHLLYFVLTPFFTAAIMYASNTKDLYVPYIDCLFLCVSAETITGLVTVAVSQLTLWQQIILFCHICTGNIVIVSCTMVLVRRHLFRKRFKNLLKRNSRARKAVKDLEKGHVHNDKETGRFKRIFGFGERRPKDQSKKRQKINANMVQRVDGPAVHVNPTGHQTTIVDTPDTEAAHASEQPPLTGINDKGEQIPVVVNRSESQIQGILHTGDEINDDTNVTGVRISEPAMRESPEDMDKNMPRSSSIDYPPIHHAPVRPYGRSQTVSFMPDQEHARGTTAPYRRTKTFNGNTEHVPLGRSLSLGGESTSSRPFHHHMHDVLRDSRKTGLGGFPLPFEYLSMMIDQVPKLSRHMTIPHTSTVATSRSGRSRTVDDNGGFHQAPYLSFDAIVTGNSHFHGLSHAQQEELGGVEYRALNFLAWFIPIYWIFWISLCIILGAPYLASASGTKYRDVLMSQRPKPPHNTTWFWIFNSVSSMTNAGMSLSDNSMQGPLGDAFLLLIPMGVLILVGNTSFPIMLRILIWVLSKIVSKKSRLYEDLCFLLDHPRRCFYYLFPARQTWLLACMVFGLTAIDWVFLIILDLNLNPKNGKGTWVFDSLFQSISVRSAGFQAFDILSLAPAEQMLQVIMMYLAVFPLTLLVRTTNVYEERSLGITRDDDNGPKNVPHESEQRKVWGKFLSIHARRQLAFDAWWLVLSVWIVCIAERGKFRNHRLDGYMTIFNIMYEVTSAYGTVGLSTGSPGGTSLSGEFSVISKLVIIAMMIRGRHRGLPVAIDRAVMLPGELREHDAYNDTYTTNVPGPTEDSHDVTDNMYNAYHTANAEKRTAEDHTIAHNVSEEPHVRYLDGPAAA